MRKQITRYGMAGIFALVGVQSAFGQPDCETTFNQCDNDDWENASCWDGGKPTLSLVACVPSGKTATVRDENAACEGFVIEDGATVLIKSGRTLTMHGSLSNNELDGDIQIERGGQLNVNADLSVFPSASNDGEIIGLTGGTGAFGKIAGSSELEIEGGGTRATSVVISGALDIEVRLVNDGYVVADQLGQAITLKTNSKLGDAGVWVAEKGGKLVVDIGVTGGNDWSLEDTTNEDGDQSVIEFNFNCTSLTGDFIIQNGRLDVDANVDTTGNLVFASDGETHPRIDVVADKYVEFGQ